MVFCIFKKTIKMQNSQELIILETFTDTIEASISQNKLKLAGIESILLDQNVFGLNPIAGVALKVLVSDLEKAKAILF